MVTIMFNLGRLTFEHINSSNLIEGKFYYIKTSGTYIKGRLHNKPSLLFHTLNGLHLYSGYYYQLISKKHAIQETMEARSLSIILKMITGDETFKW